MDWKPISEADLRYEINAGWEQMDIPQRRLWDAIRIGPEKWIQHPYGDLGGGFWVVAIIEKPRFVNLSKDGQARRWAMGIRGECKMKIGAMLLLSALLFGNCSCCDHVRRSPENDPVSWGKALHEVRIGVTANQQQYRRGEEIVCQIYIKNGGTSAVEVSHEDERNIAVYLKGGAYGITWQAEKLVFKNVPPDGDVTVLEPGESTAMMTVSVVSDTNAVGYALSDSSATVHSPGVAPAPFLVQGRYSLSVVRFLRIKGHSKGRAGSGEVHIQVN